jgi:hypothetical protein
MFRTGTLKRNQTLMIIFVGILISSYSYDILLNQLSANKSGIYEIPTYKNNNFVRIVPQIDLNAELFSHSEIMDFVTEAMTNSLNLSFDNYELSMTSAATRYYTQSGWGTFSNSIEQSGIYKNIFTNKEIIEFFPKRAPFIEYSDVAPGHVNGEYRKEAYWVWRVKVSGTFSTKSLKKLSPSEELNEERRRRKPRTASVEFTLDLQRVPKGKGASAVKINNASDWKIEWGKK